MNRATRRLYALADTPQVQPGWTNFDGTSTLYITAETGLNQVSLTFLNDLGDTVTLPQGTPAEYGSLPAGQSAVYLFFEGLITNPEVEAIQVTPLAETQWATAVFNDSSGLAYLVLAPTGQVQIDDGEALEFRLTDVTASTANAGPVYVTFAGAAGIDPDQTTTQVFVSVQNPPVTGNQALDLVVGFAGSDLVFTGGQPNELTLFLTNPNPTPLVPGGTDSWGPTPPTFQLSLVFDDGAGALTTTAAAAGISVNLSDAFGNAWSPVAAQTQGPNPTWIMQPSPNGGGQVLGTGESATVTFSVSGIQTQLPQGPTFAYLSYTNVPGYNDGFYALEILKVDPITVASFTATPPAVTGATAPTEVSLAFEVKNASFVTITNTPYAAPATSVDFSGSTTATVQADTVFTLVAANFATGQVVAQPLSVPVSDPSLLAGSVAAASLSLSGSATVQGGLTVSGSATVQDTLAVSGSATMKGGLAVAAPGQPWAVQTDGDAYVGGTLSADGDVKVGGTLEAAAVQGNTGTIGSLSTSALEITQDGGTQPSLRIGEWTLTDAGSGLLVIACGEVSAAVLTGVVDGAAPTLWVGGNQVICSGSPIGIYSPNRGAYLNATSKGSGSHPDGWEAWSYWMQDPDIDSNLVITYGNVGQ